MAVSESRESLLSQMSVSGASCVSGVSNDSGGVPVRTTSPGAQPPAVLSAVSIKPVPFWRNTPDMWFLQLEAQFRLAGITHENTKFYHVVSALDESVIRIVSDIVFTPPDSNAYTLLKETLTSRLSGSENQKLKQLLTELTLGDWQPSQLLREMRNLSRGKLSQEVLKSLWLQRLPSNMQAILACNPGTLEELATCADKIAEVSTRPEVYAVSQSGFSTDQEERYKQLSDKFDRLEKMFERSLSIQQGASRSRPFNKRARSSSRSARRDSSTGKNKEFCWYHFRFGTNAKKCVLPCSFQGNLSNVVPSKNVLN